jgi:hypothetical protein
MKEGCAIDLVYLLNGYQKAVTFKIPSMTLLATQIRAEYKSVQDHQRLDISKIQFCFHQPSNIHSQVF